MRVIDILRDDSSGIRLFKTKQGSYESHAGLVSRMEILEALRTFPTPSNSRNKGAFEIPDVESLLLRLGLSAIKASSREKGDLRAHFANATTGENTLLGFSIKSEVGGPATLLNSSTHTLFRYSLLTDHENAQDVASRFGSSKVRLLFQGFESEGIKVRSLGAKSPEFGSNLQFFGEDLQFLLGGMLLKYFQGKGKYLNTILPQCDEGQPPGRQTLYKLGNFLKAIALGMTPSKPWPGYLEAYGGYIVVKQDGSLLALSSSKEDSFRDYLLSHSYFDTPSVTRHKFGSVYSIDGAPHIDLNMQIRFG
jgi:type II restriction enzyme